MIVIMMTEEYNKALDIHNGSPKKNMNANEIPMDLETKRNLTDIIEQVSNHDFVGS